MTPRDMGLFAFEFQGPAHLSAGICHGPAGQCPLPPAELTEWPNGLEERPATTIDCLARFVRRNELCHNRNDRRASPVDAKKG
jgi:hypothetical protein